MADPEADTREYVIAVADNKPDAMLIAKSTAQKLESKSVTLIDVVKSLGEYINDDSANIRSRAVSYLVAIIAYLSPKFLTRQQIQVLAEFLCDRVDDAGSVEGLIKLAELDRFNDEIAQNVLRRLSAGLGGELQQKPQRERWPAYSLINLLLEKRRKGIREMGSESLTAIVRLVAGEKDPRNLMLIFSMLRAIMVEWDISGHEQTLFDAVYAYFPITFRPPPNDPYGITAQDLKDRLKGCLASNGKLATLTFPSLLDRLDSTSETVKKDVLQALAACALEYDPSTMTQYSISLWDAVKFEILQAQEPFLADEALIILKNLAMCLSKSKNENQGPTANPLTLYLKPINKECLEHLAEPASRQAKASGDILKAVASASVASFQGVAQTIGPALLTAYQNANGILNQRSILEVSNKLLEASIEVYGSWTASSTKNAEGRETVLLEFKDKLVPIYSKALMGTVKEEVSFRLVAAQGLLLLSQMRSMLQDNEIGLFVQYFDEIVLEEESYGRDELKKLAMTALAQISKFKARLITDITFPAFMARLPDSEDDASQQKEHRSVLEGLAEISLGKDLLETLMRRLLNKLDLLLQASERDEYPYTCAVLSTIYHVLGRASKEESLSLDMYYDRVVVDMISRSTKVTPGPYTNEIVLDLLGRIANLVVRNAAPLRIGITAENVYKLFRSPDTLAMKEGHAIYLDPPLSVLTSTWLLAALPRNMMLGVLNSTTIPTTIQDLIDFARCQQSTAIQYGCLRQVVLYVNKHIPNPDLAFADSLLEVAYESLKSNKDNHSFDFTTRLIFSISKGLILRLAPNTNRYLSNLVSLLNSTEYPAEVSHLAAIGFGSILASGVILTKDNYAQIRLLAPQRVFQFLVPLISTKFKEASSSSTDKENYLVALSGILGTVSSDIVMPELPTLLPLLLQSLDISDQSVKIATLETFAVVITSNPAALDTSGHIPALLKRLLTTASSRDKKSTFPNTTTTTRSQSPTTSTPVITNASPQVRRLATRCITLMPKHITTTSVSASASASATNSKGVNPLLPQKREVLQGLVRVLDDPRRDVRKEAVDARAAWIRGVDDVESDDDD